MNRLVLISVAVVLFACGGSQEEVVAPTEQAHREPPKRQSSGGDGVSIEGLMGSISADAVRQTMEPRLPKFLPCFAKRYNTVEVLGGRFEMSFRIKTDGSVLWVYPKSSTIGDRLTEKCLLDKARGIRFSRPQGGEAEFSYPLELDPPEDVRPPVDWSGGKVTEAVSTHAADWSCGKGLRITAYVKPGGTVITAGASVADPKDPAATDADLDCASDAVKGWSLPDPGSYPAKFSFDL